jgi:hypothetical protein
MKTKLVDRPSTCMRFRFRKLHIHSQSSEVRLQAAVQYASSEAYGWACNESCNIGNSGHVDHHLLRTTGANLDLRTIKSADSCHDHLGSWSNIQKKPSKTFSLEFPAPKLYTPESRLQQKVQTRQSGLRQGETRPSDRHQQLGQGVGRFDI